KSAGEGSTSSSLVRVLGTWGVAAAIANSTIGGGIFRLPAAAAAALGTAAPIAYLVCALAMGLIVLCIAEAGSRVALTGGPYAYVEVAFGPYAGFMTGVLLWLGGTVATAAVGTVFADNATNMIAGGTQPLVHAAILVIAFALAATINLLGIKQGNRLNFVATAAKLAPLLILVIVGAFFIDGDKLKISAFPSASTLTRASIVLIFAFAGVESALVPSGEMKNPERTVPRAILIAMIGITLLYLVLQLVAQGVLGDALSTSATPLADAAAVVFGEWGRKLLLAGVVISTFGYVSGMTLAVPRLLFAFGRDGFLPTKLADVHPKWKSPWIAIISQTVIVCALAITSGFDKLIIVANVALLLVYFMCALASLQLRRKGVQSGGTPFRIPGAAIVPILACVVIATLLTSITAQEWLVFAEVITVATVIFFISRGSRAKLVRSIE
ncbi:MAG: APC family permease, partial [Gemmatimonadaceae bacterium]